MENFSTEKKLNYLPEIIVGVGYALFLCLVPLTFLGLYYFTTLKNAPNETEHPFATNLPPLTPIPRLPEGYTPGKNIVFKEEFDNNDLAWYNANSDISDIGVRDGKLYVTSKDESYYALGTCSSSICTTSDHSYFIQVELATENLYTDDYGIVFRMSNSGTSFFLFAVYPEQREYALYYSSNDWYRLLGNSTSLLNQYPKSNILGVYVTESYFEFYINGSFVDSYYQEGFSSRNQGFGVYTEGVNNNLLVDNLVVEKIDEQ